MVILIRIVCLACLLIVGQMNCVANHIVGGEITYACLGNEQYSITVKVYRECSSDPDHLDESYRIFIHSLDDPALDTTVVTKLVLDTLINERADSCLIGGLGTCLVRATYTIKSINLQPSLNGYNIVYQRCCRSEAISNIVAAEAKGITLLKHLKTNDNPCNSSPELFMVPNILACVDESIVMDFSMADVDKDELEYYLCTPLMYANAVSDPIPAELKTPIEFIEYQNGFTQNEPLGPGVEARIDINDGWFTALPEKVGIYAIGVCVNEIRQDKVINVQRLEYLLQVQNCSPVTNVEIDFDQTYLCEGDQIRLKSSSMGANFLYWQSDRGESSLSTDWIYNPLDTGQVKIKLIGGRTDPDCQIADSITLFVRDTATKLDFTYAVQGKEVVFESNIPGGEKFWDFGDGTSVEHENPTHLFGSSDSVQVCLNLKNHTQFCDDQVCKKVLFEPQKLLEVPNAFSPNGDMLNDILKVNKAGNLLIEEFHWSIFNRWGQLVFESKSIETGWNGMLQAKKAPTEVYTWHILTQIEGIQYEYAGNVTLIR